MLENERLREALLELQILRDRERRAHEETVGLLAAVEAYASAPTPGLSIAALFEALARATGAERAVLVEDCGAGTARIIRGTDPARHGLEWQPPFDPFSRPRNIADMRALDAPGHRVFCRDHLSVLSVPLPDLETGPKRAVICLHPAACAFSRQHVRMVERHSGLFARALATERLAEENALLAAVIEGSPAGFAIADTTKEDAPLIYVNPGFERITGYDAEELVGRNCNFLSAEPPGTTERQRLREAVEQRKEGKFLLHNARKSGELFWNELTLYPVHGPDGQVRHLVATQNDVTRRITAEIERDRIRQRMTQALAVTQGGFLMLDRDGVVVLSNEALQQAFPAPGPNWAVGTSFGENRDSHLVQTPPRPGFDSLPDCAELGALAVANHGQEITLSNGKSYLLRARLDADGALVVTATNISRLKTIEALLRQRAAAVDAAFDGIVILNDVHRILYLNQAAARLLGFDHPDMALGRDWRKSYGIRDESFAGAYRLERLGPDTAAQTHEITYSPREDEGAVLIIRDITERLAEERRQEELQRALLRAQRQEALTQLAAGVAHDFNNLLSAIQGSATLITGDNHAGQDARDHAERIIRAGQRAGRLVNRLLDLGAEPREGGVFELRMALGDVAAMTQSSLPPAVGLDVDIGDEMMLLRGDAGTLNQICVNLILNARDAMPKGGGRIALTVSTIDPTRARALRVGTLSAGIRYACISVRDTGSGMDEETCARIFDPHFSTKGARGTGLGLTMVALLVRGAGGAVDVSSAPGRGSVFSVYWPVQTATGPSPQDEGQQVEWDLSGMTFLIVDDDHHVGEVLQAFLERQGAEVAFCDMPDIACEIALQEPRAWTAIITDYDMPGMNGGDLVEALGRDTPDIPVFVMTALARRLTDPRIEGDRVRGLFAKPINLGALAGALAALRACPETCETER
ncbi:PAS domain S-box-containing protein [Rhodovulum bhavnagarense]|uniref:histidine kinase n=1 Tax=Rhodovulum bhavnagarense TaxID=992286 RepID=A0A4R2R9U4_9RHOB|nr:PAS domain-containing protein [Rhodovulum bhavnagarense]TCP60010.1 PAS domain S-box-containing protein [Rhodovulum bhavnagarense]